MAAMVASLLLILAVVSPTRPFADERQLLDRRLETLRRILPDAPNPGADLALAKEMTETAHLSASEILARPPAENGGHGDIILDVTALGHLVDIDRFFRSVALSYRLIDVESLTLAATPENVVRMTTVLRLPYRPIRAPLPPPPDGTRTRFANLPRALADAYVKDQSLALAKSEMIARLRRARRDPRLFLSELASVVRDRPVVLSSASFGDDFTVRGLTVGEGPARALESRFERGFFRVSEFLMARRGACRQFEVRGKSPIAGIDSELALPTEDAFSQGDAACRIDRDTGRAITVKGPSRKAAGKGTFSLRLPDIDLADLFLVLHVLTAQGFLVDGDLTGRVSVDLSRVTIDEALAAIQKAAEVRISDVGPVRRVSAGRGPAPRSSPAPAGPTKIGMTLKRAEVRDILAVMAEADAGLGALGPQGFLGRLSLWTKDAPLVAVRASVLDAAGLAERTEEGQRILERHPGSDEPVFPVAGAAPDPRLVLRPQDLTVEEFELTGLASADGENWVAFAYSPAGALHAYRPGDHLSDGIVRSVESTDLLLDTEDGPVRVTLPIGP
jgi:hypothetical protein